MRHCDLCIIGSGPGGQKAAIQAAKLGKDVVVIERMEVVGGVAINTGTIPSKALREAVLAVTGAQNIVAMAGDALLPEHNRLARLTEACNRVIRGEVELVRHQLVSNGVEILHGHGSFINPTTVVCDGPRGTEQISAERVLIATGTTPARPREFVFDEKTILTSDEILRLRRLPRTMIVVGGGVIGTEYASMMAALGVRVTIVEGRPRLLDFIDAEIGEALQYHLRQAGCTLRLSEKVVSIRAVEPPPGARSVEGMLAEATLESGKTLVADALLYCIGRTGATSALNLAAAGLSVDGRGRVAVNEHFQTSQPHIYAVGDVIGFPALASTSMEQGRLAALHMFDKPGSNIPDLIPYGIYSIPEISMVGWTEERLTKEGVPYESGIAQYKEIARGQLLNDEVGMLKLLIHQETRALLGVHAIGTGATELIHIGQAVMAFGGTVDYLVNTVFNYPTLAECYKVAAYNGLNKLRHT
ncbi:MAG: Si-specific NAD(P)(+) transhydrogenase [Planctomyces sp.]|nr:Si-specific NAD(P)(+) transhydrogenase [Planctomyces sp.]MBA4119778.1 Si-specific NAD(P)(+) transhydrogenase [Isosphaera sp.]